MHRMYEKTRYQLLHLIVKISNSYIILFYLMLEKSVLQCW